MQNVKSLFRFSGDRRHLELMCDHAQNEFDNLASPTLYYTDVNHCLSHCPPTSQPTWDLNSHFSHSVPGPGPSQRTHPAPWQKASKADVQALWTQGKFCARTFQRLFKEARRHPMYKTGIWMGVSYSIFLSIIETLSNPVLNTEQWQMHRAGGWSRRPRQETAL